MLLKRIYDRIVLHRWELGFIDQSIDDILDGKPLTVRKIKSPWNDRWFADPFILNADDQKAIVLVEDYRYKDHKGRISQLVIDLHDMEISSCKVILELPTHLSFPAFYIHEDKIFIYPENNNHGKSGLWLYEYNPKERSCRRLKQLCREPLADAYQTDLFGKKLLFSTKEPNANKNELGVYEWDVSNMEYSYKYSLIFKENIARNAGAWFLWNGFVCRPAQECNVMYGHAVVLQKIESDGCKFTFHELRRLEPFPHTFGIHTFNHNKGLTIIDMKVFRHPWIANPLFKLRNLVKR